jgi:hypothetical protein
MMTAAARAGQVWHALDQDKNGQFFIMVLQITTGHARQGFRAVPVGFVREAASFYDNEHQIS